MATVRRVDSIGDATHDLAACLSLNKHALDGVEGGPIDRRFRRRFGLDPALGVGLEIGERCQHQDEPDTVGDRVMDLDHDCCAPTGEPADEGQPPLRLGAIERLPDPLPGELVDVRDVTTTVMVAFDVVPAEIDRVDVDPPRTRLARLDALTQPGDRRDHAIEALGHAFGGGLGVELPDHHHGRPQMRVLLDVPDDRIGAAHHRSVLHRCHVHLSATGGGRLRVGQELGGRHAVRVSASSSSLRRMQNSLPSGSASTIHPVPSGLRRSAICVAPSPSTRSISASRRRSVGRRSR